jgi:zinc transport system permease protein
MLGKMFSYQFMVRAAVVGLLVSLCAALLGVSLVLKRYSMIGDGLSHVGFGALAVASVLGLAPMAVAIPVVIAAAVLLLRLSSRARLKGDALIAMISAGSLAVGVIVLSLSSGTTGDVNNYLFGSVLAMTGEDVWLSVALAAVVLILFVVYYRKIFAVPFMVVLTVLAAAISFLFYMATTVFVVACVVLTLLAVALFISGQTLGGIVFLVLAFLISPYGIPAIAEWLVDKLHNLNFALRGFITG